MPDAESALENIMAVASSLMAELEAQAFQEEGFSELSMRQMLYMNTIIRLQQPTFSDLARELNVTRPSVTTLVGTLIQKGYVKKVQDDGDRRTFHILLTSKGMEFDRLHHAIHARMARWLASHLEADEVKQLTYLMGKALQKA